MSWPACWCAMLALLALLVVGQGCGEAAGASHAAGFDPTVRPTEAPLGTTTSGAAGWTVSFWTAPSPPRKGVIEVLLRLTDSAGGAVDGLALEVIPWMPAHGHGGSTRAVVTPQGDGWYLVAPVYLYMSGVWELRTSVEGFPDDGVVPVLDVLP